MLNKLFLEEFYKLYKVYSNKSFLLLIIIIDNISSNDNSYYKLFFTESHIGHFSNGILEI